MVLAVAQGGSIHATPAAAPLPTPAARMYGGITVGGNNARSGAAVTAFAGDLLCGTASGNGLYDGTLYYLDITATPSTCTVPGTSITFKVDGVPATATNGPISVPPVSNAVRADLVVSTQGPSAVPSVRFFGSVTWNTGTAFAGATVTASLGGVACGFGTVSAGQYFVDVQAISGCTTVGAAVSFTVGGHAAIANPPATLPVVRGTAVLANLTVGDLPPPPSRIVITYAAGWSLVGGPDGSYVTGASGYLFTFQPGDTAYETYPTTTVLRACIGYWAYFPLGGSLSMPPSSGTCALHLNAAQWAMVGSPSAVDAVSVVGASRVLGYAGGAYQPVSTVAPGGAVWVLGNGGTVTVGSGIAPPPPPQ